MPSFEREDEQQAAYAAVRVYAPTTEDGYEAFAAGWTASRTWWREHDSREITEAAARLAGRQGLKLMDCHHTPGCGSVTQCTARKAQKVADWF